MEAATVVTPILEELIEKLGSAIWKELGLLWGVKDDLKKLESLFLTVSAVLEDAERRPISDRALQKWLKDLKDAAFDADDVLDEFQTEAMRWMNVHNTVTGKAVSLVNDGPVTMQLDSPQPRNLRAASETVEDGNE